MSQFTVRKLIVGDMMLKDGAIVDLTAATTVVYNISPGTNVDFIPDFETAPITSSRFAGGSSRNLYIEQVINANIPSGWFKQTEKYEWESEDGEFLLDVASDGSLKWSDATNVIMTAPAGSIPLDDRISCSSLATSGGVGNSEITVDLGTATGLVTLNFEAFSVPDIFIVDYDGAEVINTGYRGVDGTYDGVVVVVAGPGIGSASFTKSTASPTTATLRVIAPFTGTAWETTLGCPGGGAAPYTPASTGRSTITATSTSYGNGLNGGTPFTLSVMYEGKNRSTNLELTSDALGGLLDFYQVAVTRWEENYPSNYRLDIDAAGEASISDHSNVIAIRPTLAGFEQYLDPSGSYESTAYGRDTYNNGVDFAASVAMLMTPPLELYTYVKLNITAGSITSIRGPISSPTLPANTSGVKILPISYSDGLGNITQFSEGSILWK